MRNRHGLLCCLTTLCAWLFAAAVHAAPALAPWGGGPAPALSLKGLDGGSHNLAAYRGKVVLINFWATWCEPCRLEMPSIQRLRDKLGAKGFAVLAVNLDEPDARVRRFVKETGLDLPIAMDPNKTVSRNWGVRYLPVSFIIGPDGRVRYRIVGDLDWDSDAVIGTISQLIAGG
ncbi:MAG TPA: TlpA disulfide reductase family protein [Burkholderiales bacterium]|nr:TlpA disulfide reductase family protein [Burkholderiales bacterium]